MSTGSTALQGAQQALREAQRRWEAAQTVGTGSLIAAALSLHSAKGWVATEKERRRRLRQQKH